MRLVEARIRSFGAGMEPPPDARLENGWWTWQPHAVVLDVVRLTQSPFTRDYDLCWRLRCKPLHTVVASHPPASANRHDPAAADASIDVVELRACTRVHHR